jgi:hypothetical protein
MKIQTSNGLPINMFPNNVQMLSITTTGIVGSGTLTNTAGNTTLGALTIAAPPALSYTTVPTINSNQIGYISSNAGGSGTTATTSLSAALASITLNVGVYIFNCSVNVSLGTGSNALTASLYAGSTYVFGTYCLGSTTSSNSLSFTYCYANNTNGTVFSVKALTSTGTMPITASLIQAVRIA